MSASLHPVSGDPQELWELVRSWVEHGGDPLTLVTSGSTGAPKQVVLSHGAMVASAQASLDRLGGPGHWSLAIPPTGVGGLQVLVRSALAGCEPLFDSDLEAIDQRAGERRYASFVPTQLHRLDRDGRLDWLSQFDAILIGGAAADPDLLERAAQAGTNVVRTYGMTETCGGCVYDGVPLDGVDLRIHDEEIQLRGPMLFDGYGDRAATDAVMDGEWFRTGDLGEIIDGRLRVTGRIDDVIKSGGQKIALPAVTRAVRQIEGVRDAVVLGRPDPEWGHRAVAFIVPADAVCLDGLRLDEIRDQVENLGLDRTWAPREVVLVDELPMLPNGKIDRQKLLG